jgi:hypothetical protein
LTTAATRPPCPSASSVEIHRRPHRQRLYRRKSDASRFRLPDQGDDREKWHSVIGHKQTRSRTTKLRTLAVQRCSGAAVPRCRGAAAERVAFDRSSRKVADDTPDKVRRRPRKAVFDDAAGAGGCERWRGEARRGEARRGDKEKFQVKAPLRRATAGIRNARCARERRTMDAGRWTMDDGRTRSPKRRSFEGALRCAGGRASDSERRPLRKVSAEEEVHHLQTTDRQRGQRWRPQNAPDSRARRKANDAAGDGERRPQIMVSAEDRAQTVKNYQRFLPNALA